MAVYKISGHSMFWSGVAVFLNFMPNALLCPTFGGAIADKYPVRRTLYNTQISGALQALLLAYVVIYHHHLWQMLGCITIGAIIGSVDSPARHRLMIDIVPNEHIASARALNGTLIMSGQAIGGALSGVVFKYCGGYAGGFVINALSYGAVIFTLHTMLLKKHEPNEEGLLKMLKAGAQYLFSEKVVLAQLIFAGVFAGIGLAFRGILPAIAKDIYRVNSETAITSIGGYVAAALALGSVIGTLIVSANSERLGRALRPMVLCGSFAMGVSWILFPIVKLFVAGLPLMFIFGIGFAASFSGLRSAAAQHVKLTRKEMIGRVIGYDFFFFFGCVGISSPLIGKLTDRLGVVMTMQLIGVFMLVVSVLLNWLDRRYKILHIGVKPVGVAFT